MMIVQILSTEERHTLSTLASGPRDVCADDIHDPHLSRLIENSLITAQPFGSVYQINITQRGLDYLGPLGEATLL